MKYLALTGDGPAEFDVPMFDGGKLLTEHERNLLAIEIARTTIADEATIELGGMTPMKTMAQVLKEEGRMPTQDELREFYETQARPREGDGWFPSNQHIDANFARARFALDNINEGMSVLEIGVQTGGMTKHLVRATGSSGHVTGIDIAPTYVKRTEDYLRKLELLGDNVTLEVADANEFMTRRRYDVIVCQEVLEHVPNPRQLLFNLWGLLRKKSGKILITVPEDWSDSEGEHLHNFHESDIVQIVGEATGIRAPIWREGPWLFCVVDKEGVTYEP